MIEKFKPQPGGVQGEGDKSRSVNPISIFVFMQTCNDEMKFEWPI